MNKAIRSHRFRIVSSAVFSFALLVAQSVSAQDCAVLPPGGPMAFGLLEISQINVDSAVADSPLWLDDGRMVIGAAESSQGGYRRGAVWIYQPYKSSLQDYQSFILPPLPEIATFTGDFGAHLAASGNWLAATARLTNGSTTVCLFEATNATDWTFRTNLLGNAAASDDRFGDSDRGMAMSGPWLAVIRYESSGRVHLYRLNGDGIWEAKQELVIPGFQNAVVHNSANVAIYDRTLVVGLAQNGVSSSFTGQAHVWRRDTSGVWNYETNLTPATLAASDRFGASVALGEDRIFVSARQSDLIADDAGAIYLFEYKNGVWSETAQITPDDLTSATSIGAHIAYSSLGGEFLVDGTGGRIRMFQPAGPGGSWKQVSKGHSGRVFRDWESPAGTIKTYIYGATNWSVSSIAVRAHQVLVGYTGAASLHEHGWHAIEVFHSSIDPECARRPLRYLPIGAPRDDGHQRIGDADEDGLSDFAEIYFGTSADTSNLLSAGLTATLSNQRVKVTWPRASDTGLLVTAEPQWSTNLTDWTNAGLSVAKAGDEPGTGREIMEVTLPEAEKTGYLRLLISTPPPPEEL